MHRQIGERSLVEAWLPEGLGRDERLERIAELVEWEELAALVGEIYSSPEGRPSYPPLMMVKALLLQEWYDASAAELAQALSDRLSFRRFVGLGLQDAAPDASTITRFRQQLTERSLAAPLREAVAAQLDTRGLLVKHGSLLDATLVAAQGSGRAQREGECADPDAAWSRRGPSSDHGYQGHIGMDAGSGLIRRVRLTPANVNDTEVADQLIVGDEQVVYADRAYDSAARRERLRALGIADGIMRRANKHHPQLAPAEQDRNRRLARLRMPVEQVFANLKRAYGYRRVRYRGLAQNATERELKCLAYNLRRADRLLLAA